MKYIAKPWIRALISLFGGGLISELIFISTGDPNRPVTHKGDILPLVYAGLLYILLTLIVKNKKGNTL